MTFLVSLDGWGASPSWFSHIARSSTGSGSSIKQKKERVQKRVPQTVHDEIQPKAVAYLRDADMPFDALVMTKEVSNFKFEGMQVIEIDKVIDNNSLDTYL